MTLILLILFSYFINDINADDECKELSGHPNYKMFNQATCGRTIFDTDDMNSRITAAELTPLGMYPWMTVIAFSRYIGPTEVKTFCAGTVANDKYIISASSCFAPPESNVIEPRVWGVARVMVWLRVWQSDRLDIINCNLEVCINKPIHRQADHVLIHPKFDFSKNNGAFDIALIRLRQKVHFDEYLMPICMPLGCNFRGWGPYAGFTATMVGWDHRGEPRTGLNVSVLETTAMKVIDNEVCQEKWGSSLKVHKWQMCASWPGGKAACAKDIGGPLMMDENPFMQGHHIYQIAIIAVDVCRFNNSKEKPNVYVSLPDLVPYLLDNVYE